MGRGGLLMCGVLGLAGCNLANLFMSGGDDHVPDAGRDAPPPPPAVLVVSPASVAFSVTPVGAMRSAMFTVTNTGGETSGTVSAVSPDPALELQSTCTTLAGLGTCIIEATFAPTVAETLDANIVISASPGGVAFVHATGSSVATPTMLSLSSLDVGGAPINTASPPFVVTVTNGDTVATGPLTVGLDQGRFSIAGDTCTNTALPPHGTCAISISYAPLTVAGDHATLDVSGIPGGVISGILYGYGANLDVTPHPQAGFVFPLTAVGATTSQTFTVKNRTPGTIGPLQTGFVPATVPFTISADLCAGQSLAPGATCTLGINFVPTAAGTTTTAMLDANGDTGAMFFYGRAALSGTAP